MESNASFYNIILLNYFIVTTGTFYMNSKKPKLPAHHPKPQAGRAVFGANVDDVLAKKIIGHSKESGTNGAEAVFADETPQVKSAAPGSSYVYRTPEEKRGRKRAGYGVAALVFLGLLAVLTFLWSRFRDD